MTHSDRLADGQPFSGEFLAVVDETSPAMSGGICYAVSSAILLNASDAERAVNGLFADTPDRIRPFHWHKEGPVVRNKMIELIVDQNVVATSLYRPVAPKHQVQARNLLLRAIVDDLEQAQIDHLIIESGDSNSDERDKATLLDHYRDRGGVPFVYDWRSKNEPVLWIADAINGAVHDYFAHRDETVINVLRDAGVLSSAPEYLP